MDWKFSHREPRKWQFCSKDRRNRIKWITVLGEVMSSFIDDVSLRNKLNIHFKHTQHVTYLIFRNESHRYTLSPQMFIALFNIY